MTKLIGPNNSFVVIFKRKEIRAEAEELNGGMLFEVITMKNMRLGMIKAIIIEHAYRIK